MNPVYPRNSWFWVVDMTYNNQHLHCNLVPAGIYLYPIRPITCTVRVEVGKTFCRRDVGNPPFYRTPQWLPVKAYLPLLHLCALAVQFAACEKIINWSIVRSCGEYEQWEHEGTAEMAEFSAGLQTRQEVRFVILLFLLLLGGKFYEFFMTIGLAIPPLTVKNSGGGALIRDRALNRANTVT